MRRAARIDANKLAIVSALRACGCSVYDLRQPVDLLVGVAGRTALVEVKDGAKAPSQRKYTPAQEAFMSSWQGGAVATICDVDAAVRLAKLMRGVSSDGMATD